MIVIGADYEHTLSLGQEDGPCGKVEYKVSPLSEVYRMILARGVFEASEFSLSNYAMFLDRNDLWMTAVPAFPSRAFRHSTVFTRRDSPMTRFSDLRGKRVGVVDYTMTAAVWLRGIMLEEADVHWRDLHWVQGPKPRFPVPDTVDMTMVEEDLETLLIEGRIDALVGTQLRDQSRPAAERVTRMLLPDVEQAERAYFTRTGIYPIMHTVVIHKDALVKYPAAPKTIYDCYVAARQAALKRRIGTTLMPWTGQLWDDFTNLSGGDPAPYGLGPANRKIIDTMCRYLKEQELVKSDLDSTRIFPEGEPV